MEEATGERLEPEQNEESVEASETQNKDSIEPPPNDVDLEINNLTDELLPSLNLDDHEEEIYWQTDEWKSKEHIFVLSSAGKPIYSR